jgi:hypothetical protein
MSSFSLFGQQAIAESVAEKSYRDIFTNARLSAIACGLPFAAA